MRSNGEGALATVQGRGVQDKGAFADPDATFDSLIAHARALGAGAIHFEPSDGQYSLRARISGALVELLRADPHEASQLIAAAKRYVDREAACRLHVGHFADGERLLLLLSPDGDARAPLLALGMPVPLAGIIEDSAARGRGLVLFAGPAGAGIATSLETVAGVAARGVRRVLRRTDEPDAIDPIRTLLDLDPDVLRIDALGPGDFADPALVTAAEDRLVLAGIDAANPVAAISLLVARHPDRFGVATNLRIVVAQRLARRLCSRCRVPQQATGSESALLGFDSGSVVYAPGGCEACGGTGYAGNIGVFGWVRIDSAMARLIDGGADAVLLTRHAGLTGPSLGTTARALVREGVITASEAVRISRETTSTVTT